jgi:transcriptional regulator with XRE-family HTH domain
MKRQRVRPVQRDRGESGGDATDLGARIRNLRLSRKWTLEALARGVGRSKSAISQIESGKVEPSLQTLRRLAATFRTPIATLFETVSAVDNRVLRRDARKGFRLTRNHLRFELLSPDLVNKRVEFLRVEIYPDGGKRPAPYAHEGEEYGIVISGTVEIFVEGSTYILSEGDSVFFCSTSPHYMRCTDAKGAVMIWAIAPPLH